MACKISKGVAYIITLYTIISLVYTLYVYCLEKYCPRDPRLAKNKNRLYKKNTDTF